MSDFTVEIERETDGRWVGEVTALPGVLACGANRNEAVARAKALKRQSGSHRVLQRSGWADFVFAFFTIRKKSVLASRNGPALRHQICEPAGKIRRIISTER